MTILLHHQSTQLERKLAYFAEIEKTAILNLPVKILKKG